MVIVISIIDWHAIDPKRRSETRVAANSSTFKSGVPNLLAGVLLVEAVELG